MTSPGKTHLFSIDSLLSSNRKTFETLCREPRSVEESQNSDQQREDTVNDKLEDLKQVGVDRPERTISASSHDSAEDNRDAHSLPPDSYNGSQYYLSQYTGLAASMPYHELNPWMYSSLYNRNQFFGLTAPKNIGRRARKPGIDRKPRQAYSSKQLEKLESEFKQDKYLSVNKRTDLSKSLNLTETQIKTWFQNRRTKWKKQMMAQMKLAHRQGLWPSPYWTGAPLSFPVMGNPTAPPFTGVPVPLPSSLVGAPMNQSESR